MSLDEIEAWLKASSGIRCEGGSRKQTYAWIESVLTRHGYGQLKRRQKGLVRQFLTKMTGLSRAQIARLVARQVSTGRVQARPGHRHRFGRRYTEADIVLLAAVDEAHERLSGPATRHILMREFEVYGRKEFARLARISNGHLYNLRRHKGYIERARHYEKTRPAALAIGERRKPDPQGRPGYLRVDTVHQGDGEGRTGVYHINAVDEVTQWEIILATPSISEAWLEPALAAMLRQFPFPIRGFHSDNGSEYINKTVAKLLNQLTIGQTKSRPRRSNDNGLVETKNAAIIRKHMGWGAIAAEHAERLNEFYNGFLNPYVNYHRPSAHPVIEIDGKGRKRRRYPCCQTPLEKFLTLSPGRQILRPGLTIASLERVAGALSDTQAAARMQKAKRQLFDELRRLDAQPRLKQDYGNARLLGKRGNGKAVFPLSHSPWKSLRDSHIPTAPATAD